MALDKLDLYVIVTLVVAVAAYFAKNQFLSKPQDTGFLSNDGAGGSSRNILETLKKNNKNTLLLFGSQTGTAEDYANKLSRELHSRFGLNTMVADFADYDFDNFGDITDDILVFFIVATYGEGEPTDNADEFHTWLTDEADTLSTLRFTVFGLGNSTYEFYNAIGRKFDQLLEEKGGERFAEYGEGDDGTGTLDEDFLSWKDGVFDSLKNNLNYEEKELKYEPNVKLTERDDLTVDDSHVSLGEPNKKYINSQGVDLSKGPFDHTHPYLAKITKTKELFNSKDRNCVHVEFDISDSNLKYSTGDHLAVWPSNSDENIKQFLKCFGLEDKENTVIELKALDSTYSIPFPSPITYGAVIRHHLEISGPISRQLFLSIAGFAPNEETKATLTRIGNDKQEFASTITRRKFNIADALLFASKGKAWVDVPFEFIIENVQHLTPRYYSISSSSLSEKQLINITAVVEAEVESDGRAVTGVVTNLLKNIEIEQNNTNETPVVHYDLNGPRNKFSKFKLPVHVRRSNFKLPKNTTTPVILIGPGTGVAPLRGFVRERVQQVKNGVNVGKTILFYGCRNEHDDFLYKQEWSEYASVLGDKFEMFNAFSRQDPSKKVYVQDKIVENYKIVNELLNNGATIYVCGDASRMARDVQAAIAKIVAKDRDISQESATELVKSWKVQNRYQEDVW
ncbi:FAD binding domain family protein [Candida albicans]|uniref:NADPH--cytochrome P450 reductase n=2 Tax=Candida albicans TaxID=5476 RepID=A0A1D8PLR7_CANAL|nr:Ncp1p [Candida albicans SC5314]KAF6066433.1 FAD binding domain family protein [Candida albicans]KGR15082.1 NADPH-cytochrome P450 reductase [Candida albicans P37037]KGT68546.1 NADPH-cytochrome P450 reductase [Candida albicans 12C]KGU09289.1 NADPH-cytochrome P450 reductase [Candida albicans 19F]KGU26168.1 NADPH-cytochrome P450 reductase [Candida albicans P34048]KGU30095.1 NADPH-cytochrome P450 reductase [Candida albicans P57055]KHC35186.1 NADPH-cytochrome P450 reductase [Candida albicans P7|eukprot:XP_720425.2 Ncp1p [Candida albicans SC5314]